MEVQIKRVRPNGVIPNYQSTLAAGLDLHAAIDEELVLRPGQTAKIPTGIAIFIGQRDVMAIMHPRSGLGTKGLVLGNLTGVIDADYQGEINIVAWNRLVPPVHADCRNNNHWLTVQEERTFRIKPGDRIAQLLFVPVIHPKLVEVYEFSEETERGAGGFGSTGVERLETMRSAIPSGFAKVVAE